MNWERVNSARGRSKALLIVATLLVVFPILSFVAAPMGPTPMFGFELKVAGIPFSWLSLAIGFLGTVGMLFGLAWMWRIYRAPTKDDGALWSYRDR